MLFSDNCSLSAVDLCRNIGEAVARDIKNKKLRKQDVAREAGITPMSLYRLCNGQNSSLDTYLKVLKAVGRTDIINAMLSTVNPEPMSYYRDFKKLIKKNKPAAVNANAFEELDRLVREGSEWKE